MLSALLEQTLSKVGLNDEKDRIKVGTSGGLGWKLFQHSLGGEEFPRQVKLLSLRDFEKLKVYMGHVEDYINLARQHAIKSGFNLVTFDHESKIVPFSDGLVYSINLGGEITTQSRFREFLDMIIDGRDELNGRYELIYREAGELGPVKRSS